VDYQEGPPLVWARLVAAQVVTIIVSSYSAFPSESDPLTAHGVTTVKVERLEACAPGQTLTLGTNVVPHNESLGALTGNTFSCDHGDSRTIKIGSNITMMKFYSPGPGMYGFFVVASDTPYHFIQIRNGTTCEGAEVQCHQDFVMAKLSVGQIVTIIVGSSSHSSPITANGVTIIEIKRLDTCVPGPTLNLGLNVVPHSAFLRVLLTDKGCFCGSFVAIGRNVVVMQFISADAGSYTFNVTTSDNSQLKVQIRNGLTCNGDIISALNGAELSAGQVVTIAVENLSATNGLTTIEVQRSGMCCLPPGPDLHVGHNAIVNRRHMSLLNRDSRCFIEQSSIGLPVVIATFTAHHDATYKFTLNIGLCKGSVLEVRDGKGCDGTSLNCNSSPAQCDSSVFGVAELETRVDLVIGQSVTVLIVYIPDKSVPSSYHISTTSALTISCRDATKRRCKS
jgi:hypothetical protein